MVATAPGELKMWTIDRITRVMIGAGLGVLLIWVTACLVNILRFHRLEWFFSRSHNFLYSGIVFVL